MGNLFGKKKVSRVTNHDKAVLQVKQQRDNLKQYQQRIEKALEAERQLARKLLNEGKRDRAKLLLRKKRYQEQLLERTDGQLENIERIIHDLEFSAIEMQVLDGLKLGNEALKKVHETLTVEEVEKILEETREGVEKQKEIDELLAGVLTTEDEEAVEEEYAALVAMEEIDEDQKIVMPDVPKEEPEVEEEEEEEKPVKEASKAKPKRVAVAAD